MAPAREQSPHLEADRLEALHGDGAITYLLGLIEIAVAEGDDTEVLRLDTVLKILDERQSGGDLLT